MRKVTLFLVGILFAPCFLIGATASQYDPWRDFDDDGDIDMFDIVDIAGRYGSLGEEVNKTALLYNVSKTFEALLSRLDTLDANMTNLEIQVDIYQVTVLTLQTQIAEMNATLQTQIAEMNTTITGLQEEVRILNSSHTNLGSLVTVLQQMVDLLDTRVSTLEAFSVNSTWSPTVHSTTEQNNWIDMNDMLVTLNLQRASHILIFFSTEAEMTDGHGSIRVTCKVNDVTARPGSVYLTPALSMESCPLTCHRHSLDIGGAYSFNFYMPSLPAGNYTIKIQWRLFSLEDGVEAIVEDRTLTALAFPTE